MLDWEAVGVGNGLYDLAWFMITEFPSGARIKYEDSFVNGYYDTLV